MNTISISQLKTSPQKAIQMAEDLPVAISNRQKTQAYLIGADLYHKLVEYLENQVDQKAVENTPTKLFLGYWTKLIPIDTHLALMIT